MYEEVEMLNEKLSKFADLDRSEAGEYWSILCSLNAYCYMMGEEFHRALKREMEEHLADIEENYDIEEEEIPQLPVKYKQLVRKIEH